MDILYRCCAGLDVHKQTVVACVRRLDLAGRVHQEVRAFGTMTADLLALADWLAERGVTHAAMESTGGFWKPVFNLLGGHVDVTLVNAQHVKQVPGRKTDVMGKSARQMLEALVAGAADGAVLAQLAQGRMRSATSASSRLICSSRKSM